MKVPKFMRQRAEPNRDILKARLQQTNLLPTPHQFGQRSKPAMRVIAWARHSQFPHVSLQNVVPEMASQPPPMFPETTPICLFGKRCPVYHWIFKKTGQTKEHALSRSPVFAKHSKFCAFGK